MLQLSRHSAAAMLRRGALAARFSSESMVTKTTFSGPGLSEFIRNSKEETTAPVVVEESTMNMPSRITELSEIETTVPKSFHIETYGCQMNSSDSEIVRAILLKHGDDADVVLLNTCAIRENAESKIWRRLEVFKQNKLKARKQKKGTPTQTVGVLGCMAERLKSKLLESDKMVDLVVGPDAYRDLPNLLGILTQGAQDTAVNVQLSLDETYADIAPVRSDDSNPAAFVSIMRGCNNMCSYCIVPFTRGRERSRDVHSIVDNVKVLRDQGVKEVMLLGQNVNSYHDKHTQGTFLGFMHHVQQERGWICEQGYRFVDLLDRVSAVDPEIRIRFTSPHPKDFPDDVLHLVNDRPNICKAIHMPVQHGHSDLSLMRHVAYDHAFMFAYSMRAKTHAAHRMEDNVEEATKLRRLAQVIDTYNTVVTAKNKVEDQGRLHIVLVQGTSKRSALNLTGLTDTNKRCVFAGMMKLKLDSAIDARVDLCQI
ncbi:hypothetical protein DYB38_001599 [Aphanomyces astaci]|uniref:Uncharacterized protein n=4 Tax=Aphanomyces astaci TaxID=112090 RepID=A0A397CSY3_APHAT|nr:hypothetical protein DYB38_001599 [Aphanomyces astaci]